MAVTADIRIDEAEIARCRGPHLERRPGRAHVGLSTGEERPTCGAR